MAIDKTQHERHRQRLQKGRTLCDFGHGGFSHRGVGMISLEQMEEIARRYDTPMASALLKAIEDKREEDGE